MLLLKYKLYKYWPIVFVRTIKGERTVVVETFSLKIPNIRSDDLKQIFGFLRKFNFIMNAAMLTFFCLLYVPLRVVF